MGHLCEIHASYFLGLDYSNDIDHLHNRKARREGVKTLHVSVHTEKFVKDLALYHTFDYFHKDFRYGGYIPDHEEILHDVVWTFRKSMRQLMYWCKKLERN